MVGEWRRSKIGAGSGQSGNAIYSRGLEIHRVTDMPGSFSQIQYKRAHHHVGVVEAHCEKTVVDSPDKNSDPHAPRKNSSTKQHRRSHP